MMENPTQSGFTMTESEKIKLPHFFDDHPDLKKSVEEYLLTISKEEKKENLENFYKFIAGEMTWAEVQKMPKFMLRELAKIAYLKFKTKDYEKAETLFKGLAVIDHTNWYYRAALGAVFQKQFLFEQAIDEYTVALELHDNEVTSLVNRGECYLMIKDFDSALQDFARVFRLKLAENNPWFKRTKLLSQRVLLMKKKEEKEENE